MNLQGSTIAAVQWKLNKADYSSVENFAKKLDAVMANIKSSSKNNLLVAFPEDLITFGILT